jgi:molecular chaperone DnaK
VESALAEARSTLAGTPSVSAMKDAHEKLTKASHKLAEAMYKASSAQTAQGAPGGDGAQPHTEQKKDEGVIDAEYVDVEDKK